MSEIIATVILIKLYFQERKKADSTGKVTLSGQKSSFDNIIQGRNIIKIVEKECLLKMRGPSLHKEFALPLF